MSFQTRFVSLLVFLPVLAAQSIAQRHTGRLLTTDFSSTLWVELYEYPGQVLADRTTVARDGTFSVNAISSQLYEVRVVNDRGDRIASEQQYFRQGQPVEIRLPAAPSEAPANAGPISALRLAHKPAKSVLRLMRESQKSAGAGHLLESAEQLERIVATDPGWFEAWNNLGSRRLTMGKYAEAAEAFRHALSIDRNSGMVHSNLGLTQLFLHQSAEAEESARRSLQLVPDATPAFYVLGMALLQQNKQIEEALDALSRSASTIPRARLAVAEWHCRNHEFSACATQLQTFLRTPRGPNHDNAEKWLQQVKRQQQTAP